MFTYGGGQSVHLRQKACVNAAFVVVDAMPINENQGFRRRTQCPPVKMNQGKQKKPIDKHTEPLHVPLPPLAGSAHHRRRYRWIYCRRTHPPMIRCRRMCQPWIRASPRSTAGGPVRLPPDRAALYRTPSFLNRFLARRGACSKLPSHGRPPATQEEWLDIRLCLPAARTDAGSPPWCARVSLSLLHPTRAAAGQGRSACHREARCPSSQCPRSARAQIQPTVRAPATTARQEEDERNSIFAKRRWSLRGRI